MRIEIKIEENAFFLSGNLLTDIISCSPGSMLMDPIEIVVVGLLV